MTPSEPPILLDLAEGVATITLNRPEKRNALSAALVAALTEALREADRNDDARVVTLTGAGKDFCAGADLEELRPSSPASIVESARNADGLVRLYSTIRDLGKPVIALVRGRALGGGCGLAIACDLVAAAESASFGFTEVRLGFVPAIVTAIATRNLPEKRAFELFATGDLYGAAELERFGLVNRVFADEAFEAAAAGFVRMLAERGSTAIWLTKRHLYGQGSMPFEAALAAGRTLNAIARTTPAAQAGIARFLDSRGPSEDRKG